MTRHDPFIRSGKSPRGDRSIICHRVVPVKGQVLQAGITYNVEKLCVYDWTNYRVTSKSPHDWRDRIAKGYDVTTTLDAFERKLNVSPNGFTRDRHGGDPNDAQFSFGPRSMVTTDIIPAGGITTFVTGLHEEAIGQGLKNFIKSIRAARQTWASGQFVGELAETVRFLKSPARSLSNVTGDMLHRMKAINKQFPKGVKHDSEYLKATTDTWLAYKYAAKPLYQDVKAAAQVASDLRYTGRCDLKPLKGTGFAVSKTPRSKFHNATFGAGVIGGSQTWFEWQAITELSVVYSGAIRVESPNTSSVPWAQLGLLPEDWVPTVYECVPFTFLADYFSNLGDVVDAYSFGLIRTAWENRTSRQLVKIEVFGNRSGFTGLGTGTEDPLVYGYGGRVLDIHKLLKRGGLGNDLFIPGLKLGLPSLGQSLNVAALINSLTSLAGNHR